MILRKLKSALCVGSPGTRKAAKLFYFLWLIAYEKQRVLIFPQDPYRNQRLLPFFFFFGAYLCICQNGFLLLVHNAHTGLRRSFTVFSCIYYIWLGLWVYHVESSPPRRPQINLVS